MTMFRKLFSFAAAAVLVCSCGGYGLKSPDGSLDVAIFRDKVKGQVMFRLSAGERIVLDSVKLGLGTDACVWDEGLEMKAGPVSQVHEVYDMVSGKRSHIDKYANEMTFSLLNADNEELQLRFRLFDDGLAFQYILPHGAGVLTWEGTEYLIPVGVNRWMQNYEPSGYEAFYPKATDGSKVSWKQRERTDWGYPALVEPSEGLFALVTEANMRKGHCGSYLLNDNAGPHYRVMLAEDSLAVGQERWESPWRVIIAGELSDIVESTLVTDVSDPSQIDDTSWIQPGPVSWIYWANNHGSNDFRIVTEYMDLAAEMGWPYDLIDAEWDVMGNGGKVEDALAYAVAKGVKPMIWYNSSTGWINGAPTPYYRLNAPEDREKEYSWLNSQGVAGIKVDFFAGDRSGDMDYYIDLMSDAARHRLMINFHGATIPRGWQRTWPNLMTMEAVYGAEWYNNMPVLTSRAAVHNATLPYTRNVIGSMDYTPGTFSDSQHPHITTHGHELALTVLFESSLQHMPDSPQTYRSLPDEVRAVLSSLPTAWDDSILLGGYPGESAVIARRKGESWYIAGINGLDEARTLTFSLSRLYEYGNVARLFADGDTDRCFEISDFDLNGIGPDISVSCRARGGFLMVVR